MIKINNLCKSFDEKIVLNNLNLTIKDGTIFGLIGINGAGKSTLLRILSGVYDPTSGEVIYDDVPNKRPAQDIFYLSDDPFIQNTDNIKSLIEFYHPFYKFDIAKFHEYFQLFKLDQAIANQKLATNINKFSKGMKRQLFLCIALAIAPKYLFLDEAFDGLDPLARLIFKRIILKLLEEKEMTIIISSHSLRELEDICDCYGLLDGGDISNTGNIEERKENYQKYQLAFSTPVDKSDFKNLDIVLFRQLGRITKIICEGEDQAIYQELLKMKPLIIDKLEIDFEEMFIIEVEKRGQLTNEKQ